MGVWGKGEKDPSQRVFSPFPQLPEAKKTGPVDPVFLYVVSAFRL